MGDEKHLRRRREALQPLADGRGHRAADAAIHFVEDEHRGRTGLGERDFQCERETRELAARGNLRETTEGGSFEGRDLERHALRAVSTGIGFGKRRQRDAKAGVAELQRRELRCNSGFETFR